MRPVLHTLALLALLACSEEATDKPDTDTDTRSYPTPQPVLTTPALLMSPDSCCAGGHDLEGQVSDMPPGADFVQVEAGEDFSCALRSGGIGQLLGG